MCLLMHTTSGAHKQIILPTFAAPLSPHWHVFEKGALSFGGAARQKQSYCSIPVYYFLNFLFCYSKKKSPQTPFSKHADAQRQGKVKSGKIASVCKVFFRVHQRQCKEGVEGQKVRGKEGGGQHCKGRDPNNNNNAVVVATGGVCREPAANNATRLTSRSRGGGGERWVPLSLAGCRNDGVNAKMAGDAWEGEEDSTTTMTTMSTTMTEEAMGASEVPAAGLSTAMSPPPGSIGDNVNNVNDKVTKGEGRIWAQLRCRREAKVGKNGGMHTSQVPPARGSEAAKIRALPRQQFSLPRWSTPTATNGFPSKITMACKARGGRQNKK
jgi:hypothetical protein